MENLKPQKKIIDLGKTIVKELDLDPGVDTLSKWMAHYIAEKIELSEKLTGSKKIKAENECYEIILKLWENRWSVPYTQKYFEDFTPLLKTLEKLNPKKENPFLYSRSLQFEIEGESKRLELDPTKNNLEMALKVDKVARSLIFDLLNHAVSGLKLNGEKGESIRNAIDLIDYPDTNIIRIVSDYNKTPKSQEEEKSDEVKERIEQLKNRIQDLNDFTSLRDSLLQVYEKELSELEK